jgi:hypothetical protein
MTLDAENGDLADKVEGKTSKRHGGARPNSGGRRPGSGRKKGTPNKISSDLKAMILQALHNEGGAGYLQTVATTNPAAFCSLLGKVLPTTLAGDPDNPVRAVTQIELVVVDPAAQAKPAQPVKARVAA